MATKKITVDGAGNFTVLATALSDSGTDDPSVLEISGDWTSRDIGTGATVADDNITIQTKVGDEARHAGFDNGGANYGLAPTSGHCLQIDNTGCTLDGLIIEIDHSTESSECVRCTSGADPLTVKNSIFFGGTPASQQDGVYFDNFAFTLHAENCYFLKCGRAGIHAQNYSGSASYTVNVNSCGFWDNGSITDLSGGVRVQAQGTGTKTVNIQNTWSCGNDGTATTDDYLEDLGVGEVVTWNISNSIDSDNSISGVADAGGNNVPTVTIRESTSGGAEMLVVDISSAPFDLTLVDDSDNNDAQDDHTDEVVHGLTIPPTDIVGTSRSSGGSPVQGASYDIGPFEIVVAAAGLTPPEIITMLNRDKINPIRLM